jgi:hypothetical protein
MRAGPHESQGARRLSPSQQHPLRLYFYCTHFDVIQVSHQIFSLCKFVQLPRAMHPKRAALAGEFDRRGATATNIVGRGIL